MNARMKAKRFKRLYEGTKFNFSHPRLVSDYYRLEQYAFTKQYSIYDADNVPDELLMNKITTLMMHDLRPLIKDNIVVTKDLYRNKYICRLDLWVRKHEEL